MAFVEVNFRKFEVADSTTAEQVVGMLNVAWPGTTKLIAPKEQCVVDLSLRAKIAERKADRIRQKAEANQRFKKGMSWK